MARKNPPYLMLGGLSGRVFVVTRYMKRENHAGKVGLVAIEKFDVTEQFEEIVAERQSASGSQTHDD